MSTMTALSVLDLSPVADGSTGAQALNNSLDLARHCDALGFTRYWCAEHHNLPAIASSAPDIMIGQIAAITKNMRIGSGGVMLSHYSPLKVAETFRVLEALYPGRIDLGIGRAPGSDHRTALALQHGPGALGIDTIIRASSDGGGQWLYVGQGSISATGEQAEYVFAANDPMAAGALQVLKEQGRRVPDDVAVVGFDDAPMAELTDPPLTSVHQPAERMGREMVRLLFEQIDDGAAAGASTVLSTELIRRDSS